jgi:hypothetical protein
MSFLTAQPEELAAAAGTLQAVGVELAAENAGAAASTVAGVIPAAADEVSALQASLFTAYGSLYQQVSVAAAATYEMFTNTLGISAGTYAITEAANSSAAASPVAAAVLPSPLSELANLVNIGVGNWASAASNLVGMANGGLLLPLDESAIAEAAAEGAGSEAAAAELGGASVSANFGGAASIGAMSAPAAWAGPATAVSSAGALKVAGWPVAAPPSAPATVLPGLPGMVSTGRSSAGFGAPRYGVKPIVIPAPVAG